jgi:2-succinyl-5-enolpyruvyl-6-hydroxy-3-cyclohexene-1-carboxylate synthase
VSHRLVNTADDLVAELARTPSGLRVLEVRVDPSTHRAAHAALRDQVRLRP